MVPVAIFGHGPITAGIFGSPEPTDMVPLLLLVPPLLLPDRPASLDEPPPDPDPPELLDPPLELELADPPPELEAEFGVVEPLELLLSPLPPEASPWAPLVDPPTGGPSEPLTGEVPFAQLTATAADAEINAKADQRAIAIGLALQTSCHSGGRSLDLPETFVGASLASFRA